MRKETFNSFAKGLSKDYNPLVVGKESYTDCLNGTLITYNGNEMSMQNDMGNAEIGTAFLPKGYVPVGMKEYGGIIYVAAYNPANDESQIGCFPSPQQLFVDESNADEATLEVGSIFEELKDVNRGTTKETVKIITTDQVSQLLYKDEDTYKVFYSGDQFIVALPESDVKDLMQKVNDGIVQVKLAVVTDNGSIEYIKDETLQTYPVEVGEGDAKVTYNSWIYPLRKIKEENDKERDETVQEAMASSDGKNMQVLRSSRAGKLMVVLLYKVYNQFEVMRKYTLDENNNLVVQFICSSDNDGPKSILYTQQGSDPKTWYSVDGKQYQVTQGGGTLYYEIYPGIHEYGYQKSLCVSGTLNIDNLKTQKSSLTGIHYFVEDDQLRLHWSYEYVDLNDLKPEYIGFKFYNLKDATLSDTDFQLPDVCYEEKFVKEIFSGDFTDYIAFKDDFVRNTVYLCEIYDRVGEKDRTIEYLLIYTGKYFNQFDQDVMREYIHGERPQDTIEVNLEKTFTCQASKSAGEQVFINTNKVHSDNNNLFDETGNYSDIKFEQVTGADLPIVDSIFNEGDTYVYITKVQREYTLTPSVTSTIPDYIELDNGVRMHRNDLIFDKDADASIKDITYDFELTGVSSEPTYNGNAYAYLPKPNDSFANNKLTLVRSLWSEGTFDKNTVEVERLMPYYDEISGYATDADRNKVFGFRDAGNGRISCIAGADADLYSNSLLQTDYSKKVSYNDVKGSKCGGSDDAQLNRGCLDMEGTINLLGGIDGDEASYKVKGRDLARSKGYAWGNDESQTDNEIDPADNFLIVCWKKDGYDYALLNLAGRKYYDPTAGDKIPERHDIQSILRCICSQLLVAKTLDVVKEYVHPDISNQAYHTAFDSVVTYKVTENKTATIILDQNLHNILQKACDEHGIKNYIPKFVLNTVKDTETTFQYSIGGSSNQTFDIEKYVQQYQQSFYTVKQEEKLEETDRKGVFVGKVLNIDSRGICELETDMYGRYQKANDQKSLYFWPTLSANANWQDKLEIQQDLIISGNLAAKTQYPISKVFVASASQGQYAQKLPKDYYNEVCIQSKIIGGRRTSTWVKHNNEHAPDMHMLPVFTFKNTSAERIAAIKAVDQYAVTSTARRSLYIYTPQEYMLGERH